MLTLKTPRLNILLYAIASCSVLAVLSLPQSLDAHSSADSPTIIGGKEAAKNGYPWSVALFRLEAADSIRGQFCGGTLIAPKWVLTAAHCTLSGSTPRAPQAISVLIGSNSLTDGRGTHFRVSQIIRHPHYDRAAATSDVALLRLEKAAANPVVELGDSQNLSAAAARDAIVIGWGKTETGSRSDRLMQVNVPLVAREECQSAYDLHGYAINSSMICAGFPEGGKDACNGDSGSPLLAPLRRDALGQVTKWTQIGVVSWGKGCAQANAYGVYADVGSVQDWIALHTGTVRSPNEPVVDGMHHDEFRLYIPIIEKSM